MADRVDLTCPCCGTQLVADTDTGEILSEVRPRRPGASFEEAVSEVRGGAKRREDAFSKAFDRTRKLDELLDKKFEEAKKKTADDGKRPVNPLDLD